MDVMRHGIAADARFKADGYQYGVRFLDGSVAAYWSGRTQRPHAEQYARELRDLYPRDADRGAYVVVRRPSPNQQWEVVA